MRGFSEFLTEDYGKGGLTIFDIDDTLFHTTAKIAVMKDGKKVRDLTNQEFNTYKLGRGEKFDFGQFRDANKFRSESKPVEKMFAKAKAILSNVVNKPGSRVIILTARDDFDDRETFLNAFRDHGFDIDKVRVERAGKIRDMLPEHSKYIIVYNYLKQGLYSRVRLFDDSMANLKQFLRLKKEFPEIDFEAYFVDASGAAKRVRGMNESVDPDILPKSGAGQQGTDEVRKTYQRMTPGQPVTSFTDYIKSKRK